MTRGWVPEPPPNAGGLAAAKQWVASRIKPPVSRPRHAADHATVKPALVAQAVAKHVPVASATQAKNTMEHLVDELLGMGPLAPLDRKSTRLNSSHVAISYAVFCWRHNISRPSAT